MKRGEEDYHLLSPVMNSKPSQILAIYLISLLKELLSLGPT